MRSISLPTLLVFAVLDLCLGAAYAMPRVDESGGDARLHIPIEVPPGPGGLAPELGLHYSSRRGDGIFGVGWDLPLGEIRCSARFGVPDYAACPRYELDGRLLTGPDASGGYHTLIESFARIVPIGGGSLHWEVTRSDGTRLSYGQHSDSRVATGGETARWLLSEIRDPFGNTVAIEYDDTEIGTRYPSRIDYASGTREIRFVYEPRPDVIHDFRGGIERRVSKRLREIQVLSNGGVHQRTVLDYDATGYSTARSRLTSVQRFGTDCTNLASDPETSCTGLPPRSLTYHETADEPDKYAADASWNAPVPIGGSAFDAWTRASDSHFADIDGDGLVDMIHDLPEFGDPNLTATWLGPRVHLNTGDGWEIPTWSNDPPGESEGGTPDNDSARWTNRLRELRFPTPQLSVTLTRATGAPNPALVVANEVPFLGVCDLPTLSWVSEPVNLAPADLTMTMPSLRASYDAVSTPDAPNAAFVRPAGSFQFVDLDADGFADLVMSIRLTGLHKSLADCAGGARLPDSDTTWVDGATARVVFRNPGDMNATWSRDLGEDLTDGNLADSLPVFGIIAAESPEYLSRRMIGAQGIPQSTSQQNWSMRGPCVWWGLGGAREASFFTVNRDLCFSNISLAPTFVDLDGDGHLDILAIAPSDPDALYYEPTTVFENGPSTWRHADSTTTQAWVQNPQSDPLDPGDPRWVRAPEHDLPIRHAIAMHDLGENTNVVPGEPDLTGMPNLRPYDTAARFVDLNRDRLTDLIWTDWLVTPRPPELGPSEPAGVLLNRGRGDGLPHSAWCTSRALAEAPNVPVCPEAVPFEAPPSLGFVYRENALAEPLSSFLFVVDVNGDGWPDLMPPRGIPASLSPWIQDPGGSPRWIEAAAFDMTPMLTPALFTCIDLAPISIGARFIDLDGNGVAEILTGPEPGCSPPGPWADSFTAQYAGADLLVGYDNGRGATAALEYTSAILQRDDSPGGLEQQADADAAAKEPPGAVYTGDPSWRRTPVLASVTVDGPNRASSTTSFEYARPRWHPEHGISLGFRLTRATRPDGTQVDTYFHQERGIERRMSERIHWENGLARRFEEKAWELAPAGSVTGAWGGDAGSEPSLVGRLASRTVRNEYGTTPGAVGEVTGAERTWSYAYDDAHGYGFVSRIVDVRPSGTLTTDRVPTSDPTHGIYGLLEDLQESSGGSLLRHTRLEYFDSLGASTRGRIGKREDWDASRAAAGTGSWRVSSFDYDEYGNRIRRSSDGPNGTRVTDYCFDGDVSCPPGHGSHSLLAGIRDPEGAWIRMYPHPQLPTAERITSDYTDEPTVEFDFDPFGRVVGEYLTPHGSTDLWRTRSIGYDDTFPVGSAPRRTIHAFTDPNETDHLWRSIYEDGFGGVWKTIEAVDGGRYRGRATFLDPIARTRIETLPISCDDGGLPPLPDATCAGISTTTAPAMRTTTDPLGRTVRVDTPDGFDVIGHGPAAVPGYDAALVKNARGDLSMSVTDGERHVSAAECANSTSALDDDLSDDTCDQPAVTTYAYTPDGLLASIQDPMANVATREYDTLARVVRVDDPNRGVFETRYDAAGNVHETRDARGFVRTYRHDDLDRPIEISVAVPPGSEPEETIAIGYAAGQRLPASESTPTYMSLFSYDALGRPAAESAGWPGTMLTHYRYDLLGRTVEIEAPIAVDGIATTTRYEYEGAFLKRVCDVEAAPSCTQVGAQPYVLDVEYDDLGRRKRMALPGGDRTFDYDPITQRPTRDAFAAHGGGYSIEFRFEDGEGNPAYDELGNVLEVQGTSSQAIPRFGARYDYDERGRLATWTREGEMPVAFHYDTLGNLTDRGGQSQTYLPGDRPHAVRTRPGFSYDYDASGNTLAQVGASGERHFRFDSAGQLRCMGSFEGGCNLLKVLYDARGNRLREVAGTTERWYASGNFSYRAGPTGSRRSRVEVTAFGERIAYKQVDGGALRTSVDAGAAAALPGAPPGPPGAPEAPPIQIARVALVLIGLALVGLAGRSSTTERRPGLVRPPVAVGLGLAIALAVEPMAPPSASAGGGGSHGQPGTSTYRWVLSDRLGSGVVLLNELGDRVRHTVLDPFGRRVDEVGADGRRFYAGHPEQEETGLFTMGARWYDVDTGRFLSADPLLDLRSPQHHNAYSYVANDPVNHVDPDGRAGVYIGRTTMGGAGVGTMVSSGYAVDTNGTISHFEVSGSGFYGGIGFSSGVSIGVHDAPTNADLAGEGIQLGISVGEGTSVSAALVRGTAEDGSAVTGLELGTGAGAGISPIEIHAMETQTRVTTLFSLTKLFRELMRLIGILRQPDTSSQHLDPPLDPEDVPFREGGSRSEGAARTPSVSPAAAGGTSLTPGTGFAAGDLEITPTVPPPFRGVVLITCQLGPC
jgi:RHS repeat-associated protein